MQDGACERLAELALNDADVAGALLRQALAPCSSALAAVDPKLMQAAAAAFQQARRQGRSVCCWLPAPAAVSVCHKAPAHASCVPGPHAAFSAPAHAVDEHA